MEELVRALNTDIDWLKEHTRIAELARRWIRRRRPPEALLRGRELQQALEWATRRPRDAPLVTAEHANFLRSSLAGVVEPLNIVNVIGLLAFIPGSFSVVSLVKYGLELQDFYPPLQNVFDVCHKVINWLLGPLEPYLNDMLSVFKSWFAWQLRLDPSWKHISFLMLLFFKSFARALGGPKFRSRVVIWSSGVLISLTIGIALGILPIGTQPNDSIKLLMNTLVLIVPLAVMAALFVGSGVHYCIILARINNTTWWQEFRARPSLPYLAAAVSVVVCLGALWFAGVVGNITRDLLYLQPLLELPRSLVVGIGIVFAAIAFLSWAALNAASYSRENETSWLYEFWHNQWTAVALSIFIVIAGAFTFLAFNAVAINVGS